MFQPQANPRTAEEIHGVCRHVGGNTRLTMRHLQEGRGEKGAGREGEQGREGGRQRTEIETAVQKRS